MWHAKDQQLATYSSRLYSTVMAREISPPKSVIQQLESTNWENQRLRGQNQSFAKEIQKLKGETHGLGAVIETVKAKVTTLTATKEQLYSDIQQLGSENQSSSGVAVEQPSPQPLESLYVQSLRSEN